MHFSQAPGHALCYPLRLNLVTECHLENIIHMSTLDITNPWSGQLHAQVARSSTSQIIDAMAAARRAQPLWAARSLDERIGALERFGAALEAQAPRLAAELTAQSGKPIRQALSEVRATVGRVAFFTGHVAHELAPRQVAGGATAERVTFDPLGVIANISAWNYPYFVGANVFVPALLAGNAVLYKPSEITALTGASIARLLHEAGVPKDIFVCIQGDGAEAQTLLAQRPDGVFFTGSHATGVAIATQVAAHLGVLQLELGGKDPIYVHSDVDVAAVASAVADGAFYNAGQSCCAVERIYVHQDIHSPFVEHFTKAAKALTLGDPALDTTDMGPLARRAQLQVLQDQLKDAQDKGAKVVCGGGLWDKHEGFWQPTVVTQVDHSMSLMKDESFGPIIGIMGVDGPTQARALMADTAYGLTAGVYSRSQDVATDILSGLSVGSAYWNCCDRVSPALPWSGRGHSGVGSTLGLEGIRAFVQPRAWHLRAGQ